MNSAKVSARLVVALLNYFRLSNHRSLRPHDCFLLALFVGRALACGDFVESAPLCFHPHVRVARKHSAGNVPGDAHNHFVAGGPFNMGAKPLNSRRTALPD